MENLPGMIDKCQDFLLVKKIQQFPINSEISFCSYFPIYLRPNDNDYSILEIERALRYLPD